MNTILSSGTVVTIAVGETYTIKVNEVMINGQIYRKSDIELTMSGNGVGVADTDVKIGIQKRDGVKNLPANLVIFSGWTIDTVVATVLATCVLNISDIIRE